MIGIARSAQECLDFASFCKEWLARVCILVSPSDVTPGGKAKYQAFWTHRFWIDSAMPNDVLSGTWDFFITAGEKCECLRRATSDFRPPTLKGLYQFRNRQFPKGEFELVQKQPIANTTGLKITYWGSQGAPVYGQSSQLRAMSLKEVQDNIPQRPRYRSQSSPNTLGKLMLMGCHPFWIARESMNLSQIIDAAWSNTPCTLRVTVLNEIVSDWPPFSENAKKPLEMGTARRKLHI